MRKPKVYFACSCGHAWLNHGEKGCSACNCDEARHE